MQGKGKTLEETMKKVEDLQQEIKNLQEENTSYKNLYEQLQAETTEHKQAEELLKTSEEKYKNLFEFAGDALFTMDITEEGAHFLDCNERTLKLFGCTHRDQIIGKIPEDFSPAVQPDGQPSNEKAFKLATAVMEGHPQIFEWMHYRLDGTPFWVEVNLTRIEIKGTPSMQAVVRDITDRKEAERKFKDIAESMADWIWEVDADGIYTYCSAKVELILGYRANEIIGKTPFDLMPSNEAKRISTIFSEFAREKKPFRNLENWNLTKDGQRVCLLTSGVPILGNGGELLGYRGVDSDITERKEAEEEREKLLGILADKNAELKSIVHIASYDLRTPLVNVSGFGDKLADDFKELQKLLRDVVFDEGKAEKANTLINDSIPESLRFINAGTGKMHMLLEGMLQVSQIGSAEINIGRLDMNKIVSHVIENAQLKATLYGATITTDEISDCFGDIAMINQLFSNLIENALRYLDKKRKGKIHISGRTEGHVSIYCVEDNGIGIAPEHQDKIFEIFHRLEPEDSAGGEGLGLTIVTRILDRNDGTIRVESESGKGSRFFVSLPSAEV